MKSRSRWVIGRSRSGKTERLVEWFQTQMTGRTEPIGVLVFAAIGDNRLELSDRLSRATQGKWPFYATTPLGFFQDEVLLFWPLLIQQLGLKGQFPLRLAPETEQELATQCWREALDSAIATQAGLSDAALVRRLLDILQLSALAGRSLDDVPGVLTQGLGSQIETLAIAPEVVGTLLQTWQAWCLEQGFLTYGIITGLYIHHLLPHPTYQQHLRDRGQMIVADDVDEYPAIMRPVFEHLLDSGATGIFTYNPEGAIRIGLGANPACLAELAHRCQIESISIAPGNSLGAGLDETVVRLVMDPMFFGTLPESIQTLQTTSRSQLLRRTATVIIESVKSGHTQPREIAVIAPGLDAIARYSFMEILTNHQIPVEPLNDQRPLTAAPIVRSLLTLLTLVYPGLGRLCDRTSVAELLGVLSRGAIDPVRAGLLADHCWVPHSDRPNLLAVETFSRWDRLGYQAAESYQAIVQWILAQRAQLDQRLIPNGVTLLDRAVQHFFQGGVPLSFDQLSALRQFMETAQHYWEVQRYLQRGRSPGSPALVTSRFIQLLRSGVVTANPYPVRPFGAAANAVTLATVFQYRSSRRSHRWQFWMDVGSPRWLMGVDSLFAAPLFLHGWSGNEWTPADTLTANEQRLRRILLDLLVRTSERLYLCHSDLATSGQEQTGILLSLVNATIAPEG